MKRSLALFAPALALALAAAGQSHAGPIVVGPSVTVSWTASTSDVPGSQGGGVFFTPEGSTPTITQATQIAATQVLLSTSASTTDPETISGSSSNYSLTVDLTHSYVDALGNTKVADAKITFNSLITGSMSGSPSPGVDGAAELNNSITDIFYNGSDHLVPAGTTNPSALVTLGDATVNVQYYSFAPILPGQSLPGAISFDITPAWGGGISQGGKAPEPSSIVLGCLGLSCIGGVFYRSRRRKAAEGLKAMAV